MNLLSRTVFSVDLADPSSETARKFKENIWKMMQGVGKPNLVDFFPLLRKFDPQGIRRSLTKYVLETLVYLNGMIDQRLESRKGQQFLTSNDMLDILLNIREEGNEHMDEAQIQLFILDLFIVGTDPTSTTLEWEMTELLRNPEVMMKAKAELDEVIGQGKLIEESDIAQLPYLQAVIKETVRLHPVAPLLLPRKAESDVEIGGYIIP